MTLQEFWTKTRTWAGDLAGLVVEMTYALGRALKRGWVRLRPYLLRAWDWSRPRLQLAREWVLPRARSSWTRLRSWGRAVAARVVFGARRGLSAGRAILARLRRPMLLGVRTLVMAAVLGGVTLALGRALVRHTPVGQIAVRQVEWGGAGVIEQDFGPGLHLNVAGRDTWHFLRAGTHLVSFASDLEGGSHPPLEVATLEGEACQVSVLVPYRIRPDSGWKLVADGLRTDYPGRAVAICRRVLLEELGALSAEEYFDPTARAGVEAKALERLGEELGVTHLEPLDVRIGSVFFDSTYEKKMLEKQLGQQSLLTQASIAARKVEEEENGKVKRQLQDAEAALIAKYALDQEGARDVYEAQVSVLAREAKRYGARVASESTISLLGLKNEGELALAAADELRQTLFDEALETAGGRLHIAREAAENLRFGKVTLNSNDPSVPNLLDLDALVALLMGKGE